MLPQNLLNDEALVKELFDKADPKSFFQIAEDSVTKSEIQDFLKASVEEGPEAAVNSLSDELKARRATAIILTIGRPAILVKDNSFQVPISDVWATRLNASRANIETAIRAVGRVEVTNHPGGFSYLGTGWLVAPDVIVTNRHVAQAFSRKEGAEFVIKKNLISGTKIGVNLDFREEAGVDAQEQFDVLEILYIEDDLDDKPDIAFLKIDTQARVGGVTVSLNATPIPLATTPPDDESEVANIGYPAEDSRRNPLSDSKMDAIFGDIYDVKRLQPGQVKSVRNDLITHDCSTLGGNSGSVVLDFKTGVAIGLHFGGKFQVENYAVPAAIIRDRMSKLGI